MAKSLSDLLKSKASASQTTNHQSSIPTNLNEYVGSDTNDLYVIGHKGNVPVKIKVRANSCCDGIDLGGNNSGGDTPAVTGGIKKGTSFASFASLHQAYESNLLEVDTIYDVTDKGTTEQYIFSKDANGIASLHQISGNFNMIVSDPGAGRSTCTLELKDGVLRYNLPELVIGDYLFKGWTEMTSFISDTPSLTSGKQMFKNTSLTTFCGELSALENAEEMFGAGVKLDYNSVLCIVDSIKDVSDMGSSRNIHIGYNSSDSELVSEKDSLTSEFANKGWNVIWLKDGV
jgi:hypothetical protein